MKKILFVLAAIFTFGVSNISADNDKLVKKSELPVESQQFINEYFAGVELTYAKLERDFLERSYEVVLADGTKIEFLGKGAWKEVDCRYSEVPAAIVPQAIREYVAKKYPGDKILKIERDRGNYELKLSSRYELTFNADYRIVDIDN
ncbi:MAG: PepSY-like domain-containing protein [Bacteroidaceae bacterium]|nr:PepSY-like domain-containing protein [Bacteroidaceae bacterium]